ncbi:hypothetical protein ACOME3_001157 [Neoechinorhynchus agilis]
MNSTSDSPCTIVKKIPIKYLSRFLDVDSTITKLFDLSIDISYSVNTKNVGDSGEAALTMKTTSHCSELEECAEFIEAAIRPTYGLVAMVYMDDMSSIKGHYGLRIQRNFRYCVLVKPRRIVFFGQKSKCLAALKELATLLHRGNPSISLIQMKCGFDLSWTSFDLRTTKALDAIIQAMETNDRPQPNKRNDSKNIHKPNTVELADSLSLMTIQPSPPPSRLSGIDILFELDEGKQLSLLNSNTAILQLRNSLVGKPSMPIVIDALNVMYDQSHQQRHNLKRLCCVIRYFLFLGLNDIKAVCPGWIYQYRIDEECSLNVLAENGFIVFSPTRSNVGRHDDDLFILHLALQKSAIIVTNDRYVDYIDYNNSIFAEIIHNNLLSYVIVDDSIFIPSDPPSGINGISLVQFLCIRK